VKAVVYKGPKDIAVEQRPDPTMQSPLDAIIKIMTTNICGSEIAQIMDATDGNGVDCGVAAVGYQAHDAAGEEHPELVLDGLVDVVRAARAAVDAYDKFDCRVDSYTKVVLHPPPAGGIRDASGLGPARPLPPVGVSGSGLKGPAPIADVAEQLQPEPRPKPAQLNVDAPRPRRVPPADPVQLLAAPHLAGRGQEQGEQLDLPRRQLHRLAAKGHHIGLEVDGEVTDRQWGRERRTGLRGADAELRRRRAHGAQQSGSALRRGGRRDALGPGVSGPCRVGHGVLRGVRGRTHDAKQPAFPAGDPRVPEMLRSARVAPGAGATPVGWEGDRPVGVDRL